MAINIKYICKTMLTIALVLVTANIAVAQNIGEITVKKWSKGKASAFSFSFDDAFLTQYLYVRPVLNQNDFHGTFYLSTSGIDN